jgi:hypothetical protein
MNAMLLVAIAKSCLQNLRDNGWDSLLDQRLKNKNLKMIMFRAAQKRSGS